MLAKCGKCSGSELRCTEYRLFGVGTRLLSAQFLACSERAINQSHTCGFAIGRACTWLPPQIKSVSGAQSKWTLRNKWAKNSIISGCHCSRIVLLWGIQNWSLSCPLVSDMLQDDWITWLTDKFKMTIYRHFAIYSHRQCVCMMFVWLCSVVVSARKMVGVVWVTCQWRGKGMKATLLDSLDVVSASTHL